MDITTIMRRLEKIVSEVHLIREALVDVHPNELASLISVLHLSTRANNVIMRHYRGYEPTVGELHRHTDRELLKLRLMGTNMVLEIRQKIAEYIGE